ncbi:MAG: hypothetical protein L3K17_02715 [Thermoplasmata archaeon]|nr:hypothetical protein [Thermoplasmata archaeon]
MGVLLGWFTTVVLALSFLLVLHHIGMDLGPMIGSSLHGVERFLGRPL